MESDPRAHYCRHCGSALPRPGHAPEAGSNAPAWIHQGRVLPFAPLPVGWLGRLREIRQWRVLVFGAPAEMTPFFARALANAEVAERAAIQVERIRCPLLAIGADLG